MEKVKVLAIAPYQGMAAVMAELAENRPDLELTVKTGNAKTCLPLLQEEPEGRYDVIVSRGGTAKLLRTAAAVPVVEIPVSVYDVLRCLKSAQGYNGKIAVVGYSNITECATQLSAMMQYDVAVCTITDHSDIRAELLRLREQGVGLILCDRVSMVNAEALGLNAMFLTSDEASIAAALDEAVHVCNLYGGFQKQNALLRSLILSQDFETVLCSPRGEILFSTLGRESFYEGFDEALLGMVPGLTGRGAFEREYSWKGSLLLLSGGPFSCLGRSCLWIRIKRSCGPAAGQDEGISVSSRTDQLVSDVSRIGGAVLMGETGRQITACYRVTGPVLILGEAGTGKDTVASMIYRNGPFRDRMFVTVDCEAVRPRRWKMLLNREDSPLMRTGITIYLRSVNCLGNAQAGALFELIEQTNLCRRNRLLFSCALGRGSGENDYPCSYLKNHFSTVTLRLWPLRRRKQDIPGVAALYINQLNAELGRQVIGFEPDAMALLAQFGWDGNLAQLSRIVRTLMLSAQGEYLSAQEVRHALQAELPQQSQGVPPGCAAVNLCQTLGEINYDIIRLVLDEENGNQSRTAARLGISRSTVWSFLKRKKGEKG